MDNLTKEAAKPKVRQTPTKGKLLNFEEGPVRVSVLVTQATKKIKSADGATVNINASQDKLEAMPTKEQLT